jgi:AcrR family transcriptional regulator
MSIVAAETTDAEVRGRVRILRQARALFTAQGYAAVSMQQIADAASVNKATLYHHFRDKEDLFVAVMADEFARTSAEVAAAIAQGGTLREQLRRVATHVFASLQSDFGRLVGDLHEHVSERRRSELRGRNSPPWEAIGLAVKQAQERGEVRDSDPDLIARLFFGMVRSQVWWAKYDAAHPTPDDRLAETIVDVLLGGIGSERGVPGPA